MDNQIPAKSIVHVEGEPGSSLFLVSVENCDPIQLWGMARLLEMMGNQQWAAMQVSMMEQSSNGRSVPLEVAQSLPQGISSLLKRKGN